MNASVPFINRLAGEASPYLLQHASNPVDWYPWGDEAFDRAHREDKPVFLSIGYSSCHWCHVMAHESFEDSEIADYLNRNFISVKVDREERPDLDDLYMSFIHALVGRGGWPMSVFLTPDRLPFYGGTYFPRHTRNGMPGFLDVLTAIRQTWEKRRDDIIQSSKEILKSMHPPVSKERITDEDRARCQSAFRQLCELYDSEHGGFGREPKFPCPHQLMFLFRYAKHTHITESAQMAEKTLYHILCGGITDRIGGGFHRYSTDRYWRLPHFEKMLADQAMMIYALSEAYQVRSIPLWKRALEETVDFVVREMRSPDGGFYTALDADSPDGEGSYYLWTENELQKILEPEEIFWVQEHWNVASEGNYFDESTREKTGTNILYEMPAQSVTDAALPNSVLSEEMRQRVIRKLFQARSERIKPFRDEKILSDWNGLMIAALSKAGGVLRVESYLRCAASAVDFCLTRMRRTDGRLWRRWMNGQAGIEGVLDDYALMVFGLIHYYQISARSDALIAAIQITEQMMKEFLDDENGGLFLSSSESKDVILRRKTLYDGAYPSGQSVAAWNLAVLGTLTERDEWVSRAKQIGEVFHHELRGAPAGFAFYLSTTYLWQQKGVHVILTGNPEDPNYREMIFSLHQDFEPGRIVITRDDRNPEEFHQWIPILRHYPVSLEKSRWYLCSHDACFASGDSPEHLLNALTTLQRSQASVI